MPGQVGLCLLSLHLCCCPCMCGVVRCVHGCGVCGVDGTVVVVCCHCGSCMAGLRCRSRACRCRAHTSPTCRGKRLMPCDLCGTCWRTCKGMGVVSNTMVFSALRLMLSCLGPSCSLLTSVTSGASSAVEPASLQYVYDRALPLEVHHSNLCMCWCCDVTGYRCGAWQHQIQPTSLPQSPPNPTPTLPPSKAVT
jgi:hypothetical protein